MPHDVGMEALAALCREKVGRLRVRAGIEGVLQLIDVEVGQLVMQGGEFARVSNPTRLKAELRLPETLANDVSMGQKAEVDTRNRLIEGEVSRIDPAVIEGTVLVDINLLSKVSWGARYDRTRTA